MQPARIEDASTALKPPTDWDEAENGRCGQLAIRVERIAGVQFMFSAWEVGPEEALIILAGGKVQLGVSGSVHPVVNLAVQPAPEQVYPVSVVREVLDSAGYLTMEVETLWPPLAGSTKAHRGRIAVRVEDGGIPMAVGLAFQQLAGLAKEHGWTE